MGKQVQIKSMVQRMVAITAPEYNLRREWPRKGAVRSIDIDVLREAIYSPGVERLFREGYLYIEDMGVKIELGLEPSTATKPTEIIVPSENDFKKLYELSDFNEFKEEFQNLLPAQQKEAVNYAIENNLMIDYARNAFIRRIANVDIISSVKLKRDAEE